MRMKPLAWKNQIASPDSAIGRSSGVLGQKKSFLHYVGWMPEQKNLRLPVVGEALFLTSPFIELHRTWQAPELISFRRRLFFECAHVEFVQPVHIYHPRCVRSKHH